MTEMYSPFVMQGVEVKNNIYLKPRGAWLGAILENNIDATIEKVEDIMEIMEYNVITTPALVIDDVITIKGRVPTKKEILELLN